MSQQIMPIVSLGAVKGRTLSDIEFLSIKDFDTKRVDVDAEDVNIVATTTETDIVTQTADTGKDMYLGVASFENTIINNPPFDVTIRLVVNGITVETIKRDQAVGDVDFEFTFETKGIFVTTGQIIKITVQHSVSAGNTRTSTNAKLILWEEDTGATPQIPSI